MIKRQKLAEVDRPIKTRRFGLVQLLAELETEE